MRSAEAWTVRRISRSSSVRAAVRPARFQALRRKFQARRATGFRREISNIQEFFFPANSLRGRDQDRVYPADGDCRERTAVRKFYDGRQRRIATSFIGRSSTQKTRRRGLF